MSSKGRKTKWKIDDSLLEESVDREGDWFREGTCRAIIWPMFEHWAAENRYRLIAMRGNRRVYQFGQNEKQFITYLDIRQVGSKIKLKAWTQAGWVARMLCGFLIPKKINIDPRGYLGIRYRRRVCHQINSLLERLGYPSIRHSQGAHWADLHVSTLGLMAFAGLLSFGFSYYAVSPLEMQWQQLLSVEGLEVFVSSLGWPFALVSLGVVAFTWVHHGLLIKKFPMAWAKPLSMVGVGIVMFLFTYGIANYARGQIAEKQIVTQCLIQSDIDQCRETWQRIEPKTQLEVRRKMMKFYKEVVKRQSPTKDRPN